MHKSLHGLHDPIGAVAASTFPHPHLSSPGCAHQNTNGVIPVALRTLPCVNGWWSIAFVHPFISCVSHAK